MEKEIKDLGNGLKQVTGFYENGKVLRKYQALNGKKHGEEVWYYKNGQIKYILNWVNGKLHGEEIWYYENGQIEYILNWVNGEEQGEEVWYYEDGQIELKRNWVNGKCISEIKYDEDRIVKRHLSNEDEYNDRDRSN